MKLTIQMKARPEKAQELDQTMHALLPAIREEKGCRACRVCRDLEDSDIFLLEVDWYARANIEKFFQSPTGGALLGAVNLLSEPARAKVGNNVWIGMEFLKRMRKQKKEMGRRKAGTSSSPAVLNKIKPSRKEKE